MSTPLTAASRSTRPTTASRSTRDTAASRSTRATAASRSTPLTMPSTSTWRVTRPVRSSRETTISTMTGVQWSSKPVEALGRPGPVPAPRRATSVITVAGCSRAGTSGARQPAAIAGSLAVVRNTASPTPTDAPTMPSGHVDGQRGVGAPQSRARGPRDRLEVRHPLQCVAVRGDRPHLLWMKAAEWALTPAG